MPATSFERSRLLVLAATLAALIACKPGANAPVGAREEAIPANAAGDALAARKPASQPGPQKELPMESLKSLVPAGYRILDSVQGDLTGTGEAGAVLVLESTQPASEVLGEGAPRRVVLVSAASAQTPRMLAMNERVVPCATCGGAAGDPYGFARIEPGRVTIAVGGGSRERWSSDYTFAYEAAGARFVLDRVERRVVDTQTDRSASSETGPDDFGVITFEGFDPAQLGEGPMLEDAPEQ